MEPAAQEHSSSVFVQRKPHGMHASLKDVKSTNPPHGSATGQLKDYMTVEEVERDVDDGHIEKVSLWDYRDVQKAAVSAKYDAAAIFVLWEESTEDVLAGIDDDEQWWPKGYYRHYLR